MLKTLSLHPGLFARAWLNVYPASKLSEEYEKAVILEEHVEGVWLVAIAPTVIAASWVPFEPADVDSMPAWRAQPVNEPVIIGDADGRVTAMMKYQWSVWKKSNLEPGFDDFISVGPCSPVVVEGEVSIPGLERRAVRFRVPTEHVDAVEVDKAVASWRSVMEIVPGGVRTNCKLPMASLKALAEVEGCADPIAEFGVGGGALLRFEPITGDRPYVFAYVPIGKRDEPGAIEALEQLQQQVYDDEDGTYRDADEDDEDPGMDRARAAAQSVLAGLSS